MPVNLVFNGVTYAYPLQGETDNGEVQTAYATSQAANTVTLTGAQTLSNKTISFANGSAAAPSITFTADTNTGVYRIGADQLGFTTAGVLALSLDATGNLVGASNATFSGTGYMVIPVGTTGQRPGSPANGMLRYNTTTSRFEQYVASTWDNIANTGDINKAAMKAALIFG